ncbi:glycosyltransferase family 2 protein [Lentibacillus sediminis]|uniref:glycosyltransferase family 2 protein n=1 Tax=Lentibacillus sediminis TaxID=1940529 RepID=UPI000C1C2ABE|nr:glycosyltransferase [Lentibacillus sediminis]
MKPVISVIVPVYNIESYLPKCVDSILAQTFTDFEVILVNDGATDQSGEICDFYAMHDQRVKVIHQPNGGLSAARNKGISQSRGKYLSFVDGDDRIDKHMFEKLIEKCLLTECDIAVCAVGREIDGEETFQQPKMESIIELDNTEGMRELFKGQLYRFAACSKLYKKECFERISYPENKIHEDLATTYKVMACARKVTFINYVGYVYVKREGSILNQSYNEKRLDSFPAWKEIIKFMDQNYPELSNEYLACFGYWAIDHMFFIHYQIDDKQIKQEYLKYIRKYIQNNYKSLIRLKELNLKSKYLLSILALNPRLFVVNNKMTKMIKSTKAA